MKARWLWLGAAAWSAVCAAGYLGGRSYAAGAHVDGPWLGTRFSDAALAERSVFTDEASARAWAAQQSDMVQVAQVLERAPLPLQFPALASFFCSPGHDGLVASYQGKEVYLTPLELKRVAAYENVSPFQVGFDWSVVWATFGQRFGVPPLQVRSEARVERVRMREEQLGRRLLDPMAARHVTAAEVAERRQLRPENVRRAALDGARYLMRHLSTGGTFDYQLAPATGALRSGYSLPRHAGTTTYLAELGHQLGQPSATEAARRAARWLVDARTADCGSYQCVTDGDMANVGSSALAALAYSAVLEAGHDEKLHNALIDQLNFLRSQQRDDGEFCHLYDRPKRERIDKQLPYFSGEAVYALARGARLSRREEDLEAAKRGFTYLIEHGWSFFGSRYLPQEEHWTCQALAELWDRAPNEKALDYCVRWHQVQAHLQVTPEEGPADAVGAFNATPLYAARITPAGSRGESAAATLSTWLRAERPAHEIDWLKAQLEASLAMTLREQFLRDDVLAVRSAEDVHGGFPTSTVDGDIRIDTVQHVGAAMLRWLALPSADTAPAP